MATSKFSGGATSDSAIPPIIDRKSTRLNSSHLGISYAVFCLKKIFISCGSVLSKCHLALYTLFFGFSHRVGLTPNYFTSCYNKTLPPIHPFSFLFLFLKIERTPSPPLSPYPSPPR